MCNMESNKLFMLLCKLENFAGSQWNKWLHGKRSAKQKYFAGHNIAIYSIDYLFPNMMYLRINVCSKMKILATSIAKHCFEQAGNVVVEFNCTVMALHKQDNLKYT